MTRHPWRVAPVLIALIALSSCTSLSRMSQVAMDHSLPIGAPKDHPTQVAFSINASPTLNSNPNSLDATPEPQGVLTPSPYAVSLSAGDSMQAQESGDPARPSHEEDTPGSYDDSTVLLPLPRTTPVAAEPVATPMAIKILQLRDDSLLRNSAYQLLDKDPAKALRSTYVRDDDYLLRPGQFKFIPFVSIDPETRFVAVIGDYRNQDNATWQQVLRIPPRGQQVVLSVLVNDTQIVLKEED